MGAFWVWGDQLLPHGMFLWVSWRSSCWDVQLLLTKFVLFPIAGQIWLLMSFWPLEVYPLGLMVSLPGHFFGGRNLSKGLTASYLYRPTLVHKKRHTSVSVCVEVPLAASHIFSILLAFGRTSQSFNFLSHEPGSSSLHFPEFRAHRPSTLMTLWKWLPQAEEWVTLSL